MIDYIVQISAILSPVIAVLLAWWASRSSSDATAKQIAALEESTQKQVESMKELAKIQTKLAALQFEKETWEVRHRWRQVSEETWKSIEDDERMSNIPHNEVTEMIRHRRERDNHLLSEEKFYSNQLSSLDGYCKRVKDIMRELDNK